MNRLISAIAAMLLLACAQFSFAAADPITVETKWNVKTFSISTTGVTSATFDIGGFGAQGYAVPGGTQVLNGVDGTTYGSVVPITTNTVNVVGFNYSFLAVGGGASMKYSQTIKTPPPNFRVYSSTVIPNFTSPSPMANAFTVPLISTSSTITMPASVPFGDSFPAIVSNPIYTFTGLTAAATLYFTADYGIPRVQ